MDEHMRSLRPTHMLWLVLLPMLVTVIGLRLKLHLVGINHLYIAGYIVRHLFSGALLVIASGFVLAFEPRHRIVAIVARAALGVGSALVLDEVVFLIATDATKTAYVSEVSLMGSAVFIALGAVLLLVIYRFRRD